MLDCFFYEYLGITDKDVSKQSYTDYMESGALHELFILPNDETKRNYISAIKYTILFHVDISDLPLKRGIITNHMVNQYYEQTLYSI